MNILDGTSPAYYLSEFRYHEVATADHLFLDGTSRPTPLEYDRPDHIDPNVTPTIASWIDGVASRLGPSRPPTVSRPS